MNCKIWFVQKWNSEWARSLFFINNTIQVGGVVLHAKCGPVRSIEPISRYSSSLIILGEECGNPNIL